MKSTMIIIIILLLTLPLFAKTDKDVKMWLEFSLGYGSGKSDIMGMMFRPVVLYKHASFSANFIDFEKYVSFISIGPSSSHTPNGKVLGLQCGLSEDYKKLRISCSTGISYVMYYREFRPTENTVDYKWFDAVGIPVSLDLDWILLERFGLKTSLYYNYNAEQPFYMANLGFMFGRLK